ncbi:MAG: heme-copper oxidase subunit III [Hyphomicrobium sp.]|uniref:cytochrome c oxidase subunit 3 n=1 Tax=Hyphomicrobium sp. TaxID=82 RepID=UPI0022C7DFC4|nr:heme-copper oxidase subunit III [Hyphomicrobium sp.]MBZ0210532.1 heme-copper oxidase subunit III [Hyphomicrobium sp.]MCZ7595118.1 heme-copper oxidase subunit III [Hyphomicrobium sp.]
MHQIVRAETLHGAHLHHEHHWEWSWAPMAISFGVLLLLPVAFALKFVYQLQLPAIIAAGVGTPLVLAGISKWIYEGATQHSAISNVSPVGVGVFIIGEILIFLGLFASYWTLRLSVSAEAVWPPAGTPHLNLVLPLVMTAILVASSLTYHVAEERLDHDRKGAFLFWLTLSIALGATFLACTAYEYTHLFEEGFLPATNQFSAAFYSLTGFHGSHVLVGLASFVAIFLGMVFGRVHRNLVKVAGIYWHFVDIVWFFVASQVYFW